MPCGDRDRKARISVTAELSAFVAALRTVALPPMVVERTRLLVLDLVGNAPAAEALAADVLRLDALPEAAALLCAAPAGRKSAAERYRLRDIPSAGADSLCAELGLGLWLGWEAGPWRASSIT